MAVIGTDVETPGSASFRFIGTQVVRIILVLCWLGWAVLAWWAAPRPSDVAQAQADLAAGRITRFDRISGWQSAQRFWGVPAELRSDPHGLMLWWETTDGRVHFAAPDLDAASARSESFIGRGDSLRLAALETQLQAAGVPMTGPPTPVLRQVGSVLVGFLALGGLLILVAGPPPVRGTRPFWFWVAQCPLGFGALAWLALERPWSRRALSRPADRPRPGGFRGFGYLLVGSFLVGIAVFALQRLPWPWLLP